MFSRLNLVITIFWVAKFCLFLMQKLTVDWTAGTRLKIAQTPSENSPTLKTICFSTRQVDLETDSIEHLFLIKVLSGLLWWNQLCGTHFKKHNLPWTIEQCVSQRAASQLLDIIGWLVGITAAFSAKLRKLLLKYKLASDLQENQSNINCSEIFWV